MQTIVHIITGLGNGGAENMLYKTLKYSDKNLYYHEVISLTNEGVVGESIKQLGIKIHCLNLTSKNTLKSFLKTRRICKEFDVVNTWLYHADIWGYFVTRTLRKKKLIWNVRQSNLDKDANKKATLGIVKINSVLSDGVNLITYNSNKALKTHQELGYSKKNRVVIPNGFELDKFSYSLKERNEIRGKLQINEQYMFITVGRWDVQKDYLTLFKALRELSKRNINYKMVMVGKELDKKNKELALLIEEMSLEEHVILLGMQKEIPSLLSAADLYISSSLGESFSNSIGEAMACELNCIVTDVGDSKNVVGKTGICVDPKDYKAMANNIEHLLNRGLGKKRNKAARDRIKEHYEIKTVVKYIERQVFDGG